MTNDLLMKGLFITGTDTDVGKTYISCLIASELNKLGINVVPRKPVESGCIQDGDKLIPSDANALKKAANYSGSLNLVCPFRFEQAISPHRAARLSGTPLKLNQLTNACLQETDPVNDYLLVEGAGGFYSPLSEDGFNADLAQSLDLPVLLVAEDKLGCINQVLLSAEAIYSRGLYLKAIILNHIASAEEDTLINNLEDLTKMVTCPVFRQSYQSTSISPVLKSTIVS